MKKTVFLSLLLIVTSVSAQDSFEISPTRGMLGLSFTRVPERSFTDLAGTLSSEWGTVNAVVPISRSLTATDEGASLSQFALTGSVRKNIVNFPLSTTEHDVTTAALGASWMLRTASKEIYNISGSVGMAEDRLIKDAPEFRVRVTALGTYHLSPAFIMLYGGNYSAIFGRDLLLPVLGLRWVPNSQWSGTLVLPFSLSVRYAPVSDISLRLGVSAMGERMRIANRPEIPGAPSTLQMRIRGAKASLSLLGMVSNDVHVMIEAGALTQRELELLASDAVLLSGRVRSTGFIAAGFKFYFSMSDDINELF